MLYKIYISHTSTFSYIDDLLPINKPEFENYLGKMYILFNLTSKTQQRAKASASYMDLLLSIGRDDQTHNSINDKRDDFNFYITNFPFLSSNVSSSPAYGVSIS